MHSYIEKYETKNNAELNIKNNFIRFYNYLSKDCSDKKALQDFTNFILKKIYIIAIETKGCEKKAFTIFESVNSKGKRLEDIDLIKTHIFSTFDESDYQHYLTKWGKLIERTEDDLYSYLMTYLNAYIKYTKSDNIKIKGFIKLSKELCEFFKVTEISKAYKALIDDMVDKIKFYRALSRVDEACNIIHNNKLRFYFLVYTKLNYKFPRPLFFRVFIEYEKGRLKEKDATTIIIETIKTMISCITIANKENKEIPEVYEKIFKNIFKRDKASSPEIIDKDSVLAALNEKIQKFGLTSDDIKKDFRRLDCYNKNRQLGAAVISLYGAQTPYGNIKISWDGAYADLSAYGKPYTLDHIMPQKPERTDSQLKYYPLNDTLKLKAGHDFPKELVHDGMPYEEFIVSVLNTAGNLQLIGHDGNAAAGNKPKENFYTYKSLSDRTEKVADFVMENFLNIEKPHIEKPPQKRDAENNIPAAKLKGNYSIDPTVDFTNAKFKSLTVFGSKYPLKNNRDLLIKLIGHLYDDDEFRPKVVALARNHWSPRGSVFLADSKEAITRKNRANADDYIFTVIKGEIYMYGTLSSKDIILYANKLIEEVKLPAESATVYIE